MLVYLETEVQLFLKSINQLYLIRLFQITMAFSIICTAVFLPTLCEATPQVVNALKKERGDWRKYYRDKVFVDMHSHDLMDLLHSYVTEDPLINEGS